MKGKHLLVFGVIFLWIFSFVGSAMPMPLPFSSIAEVRSSPGPGPHTGTAEYSFFWNNNATVTMLSLDFDKKIFDGSKMSTSNFSILAPQAWSGGSTYKLWKTTWNGTYYLGLSSLKSPVANTQDPIVVRVAYTLLPNANQFSWSQTYLLMGKDSGGASILELGKTNAVPEPATLILLGAGLVGFMAFRKKFKK